MLNLVTMNRPKAVMHMDGSRQPPTGMWKNRRKLRFPRRAIMVVSRQFPCPGGSLETSKSNCKTGFLARLLFACSLKIRRSGTRSSPIGFTITNLLVERCMKPYCHQMVARGYLIRPRLGRWSARKDPNLERTVQSV